MAGDLPAYGGREVVMRHPPGSGPVLIGFRTSLAWPMRVVTWRSSQR